MMVILVMGTRCEEYNCITCGVAFTVPEVVVRQQLQEGGYHFCPNGHQQGWDKDGSENERLRRERDRLKQEQARLEQEVADAQREAEQERQKTIRLKKRASAGNCPCCKRTFANMATHMKRQHPDFVKEQGANVVPLKAAKA